MSWKLHISSINGGEKVGGEEGEDKKEMCEPEVPFPFIKLPHPVVEDVEATKKELKPHERLYLVLIH
jgi:hypothetical protein